MPAHKRDKTSSGRGATAAQPAAAPLWRRALTHALAIALLIFTLLGILALHYQATVSRAVLVPDETRTVVIPRDMPWPQIVASLKAQGLVSRPLYFELWARRQGLPSQVRAGTYQLTGPLDWQGLGVALRRGGQLDDASVTLLEGWTIFHIADRLESKGLVNRQAFLAAARDPALMAELKIPGESVEGYLAPDTYQLAKGQTPQQIIRRLHQQWRARWERVVAERPEALARMRRDYELDEAQLVILASLVQRESHHAPEQPIIARVFLNRLSKPMRLQTDPTCVYGEQTYREVPSPARCKDPLNRYSTYRIDGLPPGPIGNPGADALRAALSPSDDPAAKRYLFFVARRDGAPGHQFSETFEAHRAAIRQHLIRR